MYLSATDPRSAIIWTRSRELSLNVRYHLMHRTLISWSKCRPLKRSCAEVGSVIPAVIARHRAFQQFAPEPNHPLADPLPNPFPFELLLQKASDLEIRTAQASSADVATDGITNTCHSNRSIRRTRMRSRAWGSKEISVGLYVPLLG